MSAPTPTSTADGPAYTPALGVGVGVLSLALLMTEIVLTRIFSVVLWYHFAFLAISVALFGTAVAAIVVHLAQSRLERWPISLPLAAAMFGLSVIAVDVLLVREVPLWFDATNPQVELTLPLALVFLATATPFFLAGAGVSLAVLQGGVRVHRVYFWDLLGAGAGCIAVIVLLEQLGGPAALLGCAAVAALSSLIFGGARRSVLGVRAWLPGAVVLACVAVMGLLHARSGVLDITHAKGMDFEQSQHEYSRWNSHSLVTVIAGDHFRGWGLSPGFRGEIPERKALVIDMNALTILSRFDGDLEKARYLHSDLSGFVYHAHPSPRRVCVLGAGGGRDVLAGLAAGAEHVTGVEINPLIVRDVMGRAYREFTGDLYGRDDVTVVVDDGRSFLRGTDERYDVIVVSMVDTSAATGAGAYALTENSLYTVEALRDFMARLRPGGVVSVASVSLPGLAVGARLVSLAREAVRSHGGDAHRSVAVVQTTWVGIPGATMNNVLIKPGGFSEQDVARMQAQAARLQFRPVHLPARRFAAAGVEETTMLRILHEQDDAALAGVLADLPLDVSAVHDSRPFFFYQNRLSQFVAALLSPGAAHPFGNGLVFLAKLLLIAAAMVTLCIVAPLAWVGRRGQGGGGGRGGVGELALAGCLGLGFMLVEMALVQRLTVFVANPTHTLAAVLGVLLLCGGAGSRLAARFDLGSWVLPAVYAAIVIYATALNAAMPVLFDVAFGWPPLPRALTAAALLSPLGLLLGMPLPCLLSRAAQRDRTRLPWLWGVNGATSVLGTILATLISLHAGIGTTLGVGAAVYAVAALLWSRGTASPAT